MFIFTRLVQGIRPFTLDIFESRADFKQRDPENMRSPFPSAILGVASKPEAFVCESLVLDGARNPVVSACSYIPQVISVS